MVKSPSLTSLRGDLLQRSSNPLVRYGPLVLTILWLAFALRTYRVASLPLGSDESGTITRYVSLPLLSIFRTYHSGNHPLASALARLFAPQGNNLFLLRWPMILIGMLSLPFTYRLGRSLFGPQVGLLAMLLLAVSPIHLAYSVVVRGYIGVMTLSAISTYLTWRIMTYNRRSDWLSFALSNALLPFFHIFGVLLVIVQLSTLGLWLLNRRLKPRFTLIRYGGVSCALAALYIALIYPHANSILATERWESTFEVWRDNQLSLADLAPLAKVISSMSLVSAYQLSTYLFLFFVTISCWRLWWERPTGRYAGLVWLLTPFLFIWLLTRLSPTFYAYPRFLLFLLPVFLTLVALGMITTLDWLSNHIRRQAVQFFGLAGLLIVVAISTHGYLLRSANTDWFDLARFLSTARQSADITICEERQRGFNDPNSIKSYCVRMLDFYLDDLKQLTPRLQSSTDFVAEYDHLQAHRVVMQQPGAVWLALWQKIEINPEDLVSDGRPVILPPISPEAVAPYSVWQFGAATLVRVDTAPTLFENIYQAVQLLLALADSPADQARYYRSLAQMEAVQGHKARALVFLRKSQRRVEQAGGEYPALFLADTSPLVERLPEAIDAHQAVPVGYKVDPALCFYGYHLSSDTPRAGETLELTIYWQTLNFVDADYTFYLHFIDTAGYSQGKFEFQPFDRVYPTAWWWANQQLAESLKLAIPPDLPRQYYRVDFGGYSELPVRREFSLPLFQIFYQPEGDYWRLEDNSTPQDCL